MSFRGIRGYKPVEFLVCMVRLRLCKQFYGYQYYLQSRHC